MDLSPFKQDIDELIKEYNEGDFKSLSDMKRVWLSRKFSYIFDAKPASSNLALFMQTLYAHCVGHMSATYSLSHRLGGLYCLYCLYEIQPIKPPFKIYISLGEMRRLKCLVIDSKKEGIRVASTVVKAMMERSAFLFGYVDMNDYSDAEVLKIRQHKAMLQKMQEKLLAGADIEEYLGMDMSKELDLTTLEKVFKEYGGAKELLLKEASESGDVEDIKHIGENTTEISRQMKNIVKKWNLKKDVFIKQKNSQKDLAGKPQNENEDDMECDETLPSNGFMRLLTGEDDSKLDGRQELQDEDLQSENKEDEDLSYADDLDRLLSDI